MDWFLFNAILLTGGLGFIGGWVTGKISGFKEAQDLQYIRDNPMVFQPRTGEHAKMPNSEGKSFGGTSELGAVLDSLYLHTEE
jgi:hypothetical protein